ncbi:MAG: hypothetical protein MRK02_02200 [Candidatus Scalindua sp.]|nr:hypothetical protein [Candidatus Scalindua sp.]
MKDSIVAVCLNVNIHKNIPQMSQNTVFVIGAGASKEAGLPTGSELKREISKLLDITFNSLGYRDSGDPTIEEALCLLVRQPDGTKGNINPYLDAAHHIIDALPLAISIDNFIDAHQDNDKIVLCGKLAIVRSILDAEKKSLLYFERQKIDSNIDFVTLEKTWYIPFFKLLTENCNKNDLQTRFKSITLIIFNYDRCIEHFIYYALQNYYKLPETEAAMLVKNIKIFHPYGEVGTLPWIHPKGAVEFGSKPYPKDLLDIAKQIKTFTEGVTPNLSEIKEIREHMFLTSKLVFLGFAFHELNMDLISPSSLYDKNQFGRIMCFATTLMISDSDKEIIEEQIKDLYRNNTRIDTRVKMANLKCGDFFSGFWRSLAFLKL